MVQHQLYATMPKYVLRLAGEGASPSWYANVNPLVVVLTVNLVTDDAEADSAYLHDGGYVYHAGVRSLHGIR